MDVTVYDPTKVNLVVGGRAITNYADSSMIQVARAEDSVSAVVGTQGDVTYTENANESGNITVTLAGTSSSLPYLRDLALKRTEVAVMMSDTNDDSDVVVSGSRCRVVKPPDMTRAKQIGSETVTIFVPSLVIR